MIIGAAGILIACMGLWLLKRNRDWKRCPPIGLASSDALSYLKPGKNQLKEREKLWKSRLRTSLCVLLSGAALLLINDILQTVEEDDAPIRQLDRPEPGEGKRKVALSAWTKEGEIPLSIEIKERVPEKEEAMAAFEKSYALLSEQIAGENPSLDEVTMPLKLPAFLEETACHVYWYIDNTERIDRNGMVYTEGLTEKEQVNLTAELSLGGYEKEYFFCVLVVPGELTEQEKLVRAVKQKIRRVEEEAGKESSFLLPSKVEGQEIVYRKPEKDQSFLLCGIAVAAAAFSMFLPDQKLAQQKQEKEDELSLAYPEIVSKLCLLIGSGLTVRKAWERIIQDYKETGEFNYAYEEMLFTYYELERGMPEGKAYTSFGRRCRLHGYRRLGNLLEQNLKKGTAGLLALLQEETWQAFEDRRSAAVKLAQEAGTRLLLPMILLLLVVLVICIAPAIMSF